MQKANTKRVLILLFILLGLFITDKFILKDFWSRFAVKIFKKPLLVVERLINPGARYSQALFNFKKLVIENDNLRTENAELISRVVSIDKLERENKTLRNQLGLSPQQKNNLILANIIDVNQDFLSSTILINKGSNDGIEKSMPVVASGNILIGSVSDVSPSFSRIILIDDPRSLVSVRVGKQDVLANARGILKNNFFAGKSGAELELITNQEKISNGDLVTTSGLDNFPEGLIFGKVKNVEPASGRLFKSVQAELAFDPFISPELFVIVR